MANARNLKKCVLWSVVITAILAITIVTVYSGDVKLRTEENVPVKEFNYQQQQTNDLQQRLSNNDQTPGPAAPEGPQNHSGPADAHGSQGPARPKGLVLIVH